MDDIENIIKRYQKELMEFSSQKNEAAIPVASPNVIKEPEDEIFIENPKPAVVETEPSGFLPQFDNYKDFLASNTESGSLRVQVFGGNQFFPVAGARVKVALLLASGDEIQQADGLTDINGVVDNITLPAPPDSLSQSPDSGQTRPFAYYSVEVIHPRYATSRFLNVPVFSGVKSIQNVQLVPLVGSGEEPDTSVQLRSEPFLKLRGLDENGNSDRS